MKKVIKNTKEKYVTEKTFERHMRSIAKSFANNAEIMALMLKEIRQIHEDNKYFRASMSNLYTDNISRDRRIDGLDVCLEKIELKVK